MYIKGMNSVITTDYLTWDDMLSNESAGPDFIVEKLIPRNGVTLITGEGGIGKSFLLIELARSVSSGQPFLGRFQCAQGPVLYIDLENDNAVIAQRIRKITAAHAQDLPVTNPTTHEPEDQPTSYPGSPLCQQTADGGKVNEEQTTATTNSPLCLRRGVGGEVNEDPSTTINSPLCPRNGHEGEVTEERTTTNSPFLPREGGQGVRLNPNSEISNPLSLPVRFLKKGDLSTASLYINETYSRQLFIRIVNKFMPVLVLIDPLTAFHSSDENDNVGMRRLISFLQKIAWELEGAIVIVHHPRKRGMINDAGQMIRGASDLRNAVDSHLFMRRSGKDQILVEHDKSRQSPEVDRFRIEIKDSEDGTATYIRCVDKPAGQTSSKSGRAQELILALLKEQRTLRFTAILEELQADDMTDNILRHALRALVTSGQVIKQEWGHYSLPE